MAEVIEIGSTDDEQDDLKHQPVEEESQTQPDFKPPANGSESAPLPPHEVLEVRRRRIDAIFAEYARHYNMLLTLERVMNPEQSQRWQDHLNSGGSPILMKPGELENLPPIRDLYPAYQLSPQFHEATPSHHPYRPERMAVARYTRRRPVKKRRAPKRRVVPKRSPVKRTGTSQTQASRFAAQSSRNLSGGTPRVKTESVRVKSEPKISVKRERGT